VAGGGVWSLQGKKVKKDKKEKKEKGKSKSRSKDKKGLGLDSGALDSFLDSD
jgi:hypothetical protein